MIYLDSAATTLQKPASVAQAAAWALRCCASPGRGGYPASRRAAELAFRCRERLASLLDVSDPSRIVFTSSATHSLNLAIRSLVQPGDQVVISGYEHNAVTRTLASIPGVEVKTAVGRLFSPGEDLAAFEGLVDKDTKAVICTHVSNVFGYILPIKEIAALCRKRQVPLIVDASQSAGVLDVTTERWGAAYVAMPGHKGLLGPQGTGLLLCGEMGEPLISGGSGSDSLKQRMPDYLPDRLEAGTHNVPGIAGLLAGMEYVMERGTAEIRRQENALLDYAVNTLSACENLELFCSSKETQSAVLSFRIQSMDCDETAQLLSERGICLRSGLHCAPYAHRTAGTLETGTLRMSFSPFVSREEVETCCATLRELSKIKHTGVS